VYKVQHVVQGKYYAMKVLKDQEQAEVMFQEFGTGDHLPQHKTLRRFAGSLACRFPTTPLYFSEFVDGETLTSYCDGTKTCPSPKFGASPSTFWMPWVQSIPKLSALTNSSTKPARQTKQKN
jgi:hypothetical protein